MTLLSPWPAPRTVSPRAAFRPVIVAPHRVSAPPRSIRGGAALPSRIAVGLIGASFAALAVLQAIALPVLDPIQGTISDMFYAPGGGWLFPAMGALCVAGSAILAAALARLDARKAAAAVGIWCLALAVAAVVPTDPPGAAAMSLAAEIHRDAAAVMFIAMPLAGLLVARMRFDAGSRVVALQRKLRRASIASALFGMTQVVAGIPSFFPHSAIAAWPAVVTMYQVRGLAERALFVALILVVARIGNTLIHVVSAHGTRELLPQAVSQGGTAGDDDRPVGVHAVATAG